MMIYLNNCSGGPRLLHLFLVEEWVMAVVEIEVEVKDVMEIPAIAQLFMNDFLWILLCGCL